MNATPHVAQNANGRSSAIDGRTTRHPGYTSRWPKPGRRLDADDISQAHARQRRSKGRVDPVTGVRQHHPSDTPSARAAPIFERDWRMPVDLNQRQLPVLATTNGSSKDPG
jgi:hypothetical protein